MTFAKSRIERFKANPPSGPFAWYWAKSTFRLAYITGEQEEALAFLDWCRENLPAGADAIDDWLALYG